MQKANKLVIWVLVLITLLVFGVFCIPNSQGSADRAMVGIFEPDEGAIYDVVRRMTRPANTPGESIVNFINYGFYHYGFPFFGYSGLVAYPLRWLDRFEDTQLLMLVLRQAVSVLPMLAGLLTLVWLHDQYRTWRSVALYLLLLVVPAVSMNGTWLHPDGLVLFLTALILYFLWRDDRRFGFNFYAAAALCGVLTAAKLVGVYFFLTIAWLLWQAIRSKQFTFGQAFKKGLSFLLVMGIAFLLSNPFVFYFASLRKYAGTLYNEFVQINAGYDLIYQTGLAASLPDIVRAYGQVFFLALCLIGLILGSVRGPRQHLFRLLLTWSIPLTLMVLTGTHFKYQYWMPVGMPLISSLAFFFPGPSEAGAQEEKTWKIPRWMQAGVAVLILVQAAMFLPQNFRYLKESSQRTQDNPVLNSYYAMEKVLAPLGDQHFRMYHDYRLYVPEGKRRHLETSFEMLHQSFIDAGNYDLMYFSRQRIQDYVNPEAEGINPEQLATSRVFYNKLLTNTLPGYKLAYEDPIAKLFVRDELCPRLAPGTCKEPQPAQP